MRFSVFALFLCALATGCVKAGPKPLPKEWGGEWGGDIRMGCETSVHSVEASRPAGQTDPEALVHECEAAARRVLTHSTTSVPRRVSVLPACKVEFGADQACSPPGDLVLVINY